MMDIQDHTPLSRRDLLVGAAATGIALGASSTVGAESPKAGADVLDHSAVYRKLRFRTDEGLVFWWLRGTKYGQVGAELTPLYTNHVGTVMRVVPGEGGAMAVTSLEITLPTAVGGDMPLSEWTNPYTGETLPVTVRPVGPTTVSYDTSGAREFPTELGGSRLEVTSNTDAPVIVGDDVFVSEIIRAKVFRPERDTPYRVNDISSYHGKKAELTNPEVTSARATVAFAEVTSWQNWMNMGSRPGTLTSRTVGAKVNSYSEMPAVWRNAVAREMPDLHEELLADPGKVLDREAAEFKR